MSYAVELHWESDSGSISALPIMSDTNMFVSKCPPRLLVWDRLVPLTLWKWGKTAKQSLSKTIMSLRAARRWIISNRCCCCLSQDIQVPAVGKWSQKFSHGQIIQRESFNSQAGCCWISVSPLFDGVTFLLIFVLFLSSLALGTLCPAWDSTGIASWLHQQWFPSQFLLNVFRTRFDDILLYICYSNLPFTYYLFFYFCWLPTQNGKCG